jgi:hypothetical protein
MDSEEMVDSAEIVGDSALVDLVAVDLKAKKNESYCSNNFLTLKFS